jgi:hypothetical protein
MLIPFNGLIENWPCPPSRSVNAGAVERRKVEADLGAVKHLATLLGAGEFEKTLDSRRLS